MCPLKDTQFHQLITPGVLRTVLEGCIAPLNVKKSVFNYNSPIFPRKSYFLRAGPRANP